MEIAQQKGLGAWLIWTTANAGTLAVFGALTRSGLLAWHVFDVRAIKALALVIQVFCLVIQLNIINKVIMQMSGDPLLGYVTATATGVIFTVAGQELLKSQLGGKVPVVVVEHKEEAQDVYGIITHNRARGTHQLEPMKAIVQKLISSGKTVKEISKELGMKPEEVFRLSDFTRDDFLAIMAGTKGYNKAYVSTVIK